MSSAAATVEISNAYFCEKHLKEVCGDCSYDAREDNDAFYGFEPTDRDAIECPPVSQNKDNIWQCKKHGAPTCTQCFGWKKQINRARVAAKKAGRS